VWWAVPGAVVGALVIYAAHRGLIDDAYITLSYARNVAEHLHWGLIPTEVSNTATSPLNVLLLALSTWLGAVTGALNPMIGLQILTVALSAAMALWAAQIARRIDVSAAWSLAILAVVFANPFVNSAIGLEVVPIAALLTGLTAQAVVGRRLGFGIIAGLLVLTRPDLGIVVAVVYLVTPAMRRRFWVAPLTAAVVVLPWWAFSWYHLGSALPTTFVIKTLQRSFGDATFANGLWKMWTEGLGLPLVLALVPAAIRMATAVAMLGAGVATAAAGRVLGASGAGARRPGGLWRVLPARGPALPLVLRQFDCGPGDYRDLRFGTAAETDRAVAGRCARCHRRGARRRCGGVARRAAGALDAPDHLRELGAARGLSCHRCGGARANR
jgi:hypothetical protein